MVWKLYTWGIYKLSFKEKKILVIVMMYVGLRSVGRGNSSSYLTFFWLLYVNIRLFFHSQFPHERLKVAETAATLASLICRKESNDGEVFINRSCSSRISLTWHKSRWMVGLSHQKDMTAFFAFSTVHPELCLFYYYIFDLKKILTLPPFFK